MYMSMSMETKPRHAPSNAYHEEKMRAAAKAAKHKENEPVTEMGMAEFGAGSHNVYFPSSGQTVHFKK